jgi:hypothetical protein
MSDVRGDRPETIEYAGPAARLQDVWIALRASQREILEGTSVEDLVTDRLPAGVRRLARDPEAWTSLGRVRGTGRTMVPTRHRQATD